MARGSERKRRLQADARGALLWGLAGFAVLQLGLTLAIESWLPVLRDPGYAFKSASLRRRLASAPADATTVLMIGSSRTECGLRAGQLEERLTRELEHPVVVYNFGRPAAGPVTELLHLKRLLSEGARPDVVLIEVLPPYLTARKRQPMEMHWLQADRLWWSELDVVDRFGLATEETRRSWWQAWLVPWYGHRSAIKKFRPADLWQNRKGRTDEAGWTALAIVEADRREQAKAKARADYFDALQTFRLHEPTCRALREMLDLCRSEGIVVALVLMPEAGEFRGWYTREAWDQVQTFLDELASAYQVPVIDAREWVADGEFLDTHHLLPNGAMAFTERLAADRRLQALIRGPSEQNPTEVKRVPLLAGPHDQ